VLSLQNGDFASKTVSKKNAASLLSTTDEILYNSIWRFLALREYVDAKHNLTAWGKVLAAALSGVKGKPELEDATVIAVELLRMGTLNAEVSMFPTYNGAPMRGSSKFIHKPLMADSLYVHSERPTVQYACVTSCRAW
jgi:hypothetical protein